MHGGSNIFAANMYLAEDRILCFELVTKRGASWLLRYVKSARAETDVPDALPELISQRRRWLNGSFFAAVHATSHWSYIFRSGHGGARKFWLCVEFLYNAINLAFSWFSIANFYLAFVVCKPGRECSARIQVLMTYALISSFCSMFLMGKKVPERTQTLTPSRRTVKPSSWLYDKYTSLPSLLCSSVRLVCQNSIVRVTYALS